MIILMALLMILLMTNLTAINNSALALTEENIEENKEYLFTGEEVIEIANVIKRLEDKVASLRADEEDLKEEINILDKKIIEYQKKNASLEREIELYEEKVFYLNEQIKLNEERIADRDKRFELVVERADRTIDLQAASIENLEDSVEYYRQAGEVSLLDKVKWILIGAGSYSITTQIF